MFLTQLRERLAKLAAQSPAKMPTMKSQSVTKPKPIKPAPTVKPPTMPSVPKVKAPPAVGDPKMHTSPMTPAVMPMTQTTPPPPMTGFSIPSLIPTDREIRSVPRPVPTVLGGRGRLDRVGTMKHAPKPENIMDILSVLRQISGGFYGQ